MPDPAVGSNMGSAEGVGAGLPVDQRRHPVKRDGETVPSTAKQSRTAEVPLTAGVLRTPPGLPEQT
eukprot:9814777-Heterocapsa_arctica.AAC.1